MPRTARATVGGYCYHVMNRGNRRAEVFHSEDDYHAFVKLIREACAHVSMPVIGFCVMPNHFHLALWPAGDNDMSPWMQWLLTTHVRRYHKQYHTTGRIWQGRYKAFPIEEEVHLLTVLRYIERNPLRAGLVARAEDWRWSSLRWLQSPGLIPFLHPGPVSRGNDWLNQVNIPQSEVELTRLRQSVNRGIPYGSENWTKETAARLGLEAGMRPAHRPRKEESRKTVQDNSPSLFEK